MRSLHSVSAQRIALHTTKSKLLNIGFCLAAFLISMACAASASAQLVINEIIQNPSAVSDSAGEWFELYNPTGSGIDIDGWTIKDNDTDSHVINNGGPLMVPAGGYLVLGVNADAGANGGVSIDYSYGSGFFLSNSGDELVLIDSSTNEIDRVEWDNGVTFPDPNGASMSLIDPALDNNTGGNWCTASTPFGAGDLGTPGAANDCAPLIPEVVINEILQNPSAVSDSAGEWFELYNPTGSGIDIDGWTIQDNDSDSHVINNGGPLMIPAGGYLVLGINTDAGVNGGVSIDYSYGSGFFLSNSADELVLVDGSTNEIDRVEWDNGVTFPDPNGASMSLRNPALDNNNGANWCTASTAFGAGDAGTPGLANDCPNAPGELVINEIDYDQSGTDAAEFVEIMNTGDSAVDLGGHSLVLVNGSNDSVYNTINLPSVTLAAGDYFVVCGDAANVFNCDLDVSPNTNLIQNGSPDAVALFRDATLLDTVSYEGSVTAPYTEADGTGLSDSTAAYVGISRTPDGSDTNVNNVDFSRHCVTPGSANTLDDTDCTDPTPPALRINEIDYDQPGSDIAEFVEIINAGNSAADLSGVDLVLVNGNGGAVYTTVALPAVSLAAGDYFVVCDTAANVANCDLEGFSSVQNGAPDAVALIRGSSVLDAVSYEGDTAAPYTEGSGAGLFDSGSSSQAHRGIGRFPNGVDTDQNNVDLVNACITPGFANTSLTANCSSNGPVLEIFEIQGSGSASAFSGQGVATLDNIVTALGPEGFFIQTPDARDDGSVDTSNGIYVFTGGSPTVAMGDQVDVAGAVTEFFGFTEFSSGSIVSVDNSGNALPAATIFDGSVPSPDPMAPSCSIEFECYEGMLVQITGGTVTGPNQRFSSDTVAEVHITAATERTYREPGIEFPGIPGLPEWDGNPEVFELDPNKLGLANEVIPAGSHFDATGVIGFEFGGYELWPSSLTVYPAALPQAVRAGEEAEMTVGALNLFRLYDDIDDADIDVIDPETDLVIRTTNETIVSTVEYQRRLGKFSVYIREVLGAPDILAVSEAESLVVLQDLADLIKTDDDSLNYTPYLEEGNDIGGIDVGFLVLDTVEVDAVTQLGRFEILDFDDSLLNDRPPLLLEGRQVADDSDFPIAVMAIHGRSLSSIDSSSSGERVRQKRYEQAQSVAAKVQALQLANPDINLVVAGDFNAFEFTDGYVDVTGHMKGGFVAGENLVCDTNSCDDLVDPNLINQVLMIPEEERYSFVFRGNAQTLDHALTSKGMDALIRDFSYGRGNSDAAVDLINDDSTPLRSSDHDGLVLFIMKDQDGDGVGDDVDVCPGTMIPEGAATVELGVNNWALFDDDRVFDTTSSKGKGPQLSYDIFDTAGCSCEQIIDAQHLGEGHMKFGCSIGAMQNWVDIVSQP